MFFEQLLQSSIGNTKGLTQRINGDGVFRIQKLQCVGEPGVNFGKSHFFADEYFQQGKLLSNGFAFSKLIGDSFNLACRKNDIQLAQRVQ